MRSMGKLPLRNLPAVMSLGLHSNSQVKMGGGGRSLSIRLSLLEKLHMSPGDGQLGTPWSSLRSRSWVEPALWGAPFYLKTEPVIRVTCSAERGTRSSPVTRTAEAGACQALSQAGIWSSPLTFSAAAGEACGRLPLPHVREGREAPGEPGRDPCRDPGG